jgi:hypothetical protein
MPIVPPNQAGPALPEARAVEGAEPREQAERVSRSERAMLIWVAVMLFFLILAAVVLPHLPMTADM